VASEPTFGVDLTVPSDWVRVEPDAFPVAFVAPEEHGYRTTLTLSNAGFDPPTPEGLAAVLAATRAGQREEYDGFELLGEEETEVDGRWAYLERYRWNATEPAASVTQVLGLVMIQPGSLVQLDGACLSFLAGRYVPMLEGIVRSIRFLP
jgi:hypothetical protein